MRIQSLTESAAAVARVQWSSVEMIMDDQLSIYRVEISGWDLNEQFFVERAGLEWGQGEHKKVLLRRRVRPGALIFIRLLDNSSPSRTFPVAYRAREVRERQTGELYELTLTQVWPLQERQDSDDAALFNAERDRAMGVN